MKRLIHTLFMCHNRRHPPTLCRTNASADANVAAATAYRYLSIGLYGDPETRRAADVAQVIDTETGLVLTELIRDKLGRVRTSYTADDPWSRERKINIRYWEQP